MPCSRSLLILIGIALTKLAPRPHLPTDHEALFAVHADVPNSIHLPWKAIAFQKKAKRLVRRGHLTQRV
jgi:hypothetical protein